MCRRLRSCSSLALVLCLVTACAEGGGGMQHDAGTSSPGDDGGPRDGGPPRDASTGGCPAGQHVCGGGCIDDLPDDPANGCRLGCGDACPAPPGMGTASCNAAGLCDFTCTLPFRRVGDACVCTPTTCETMGAMCGAPDDGCGTPLNCGTCDTGSACIDGRCACAPDPTEPANDSRLSAPNLGTFADGDDPPDGVYTDFSIGSDRDVDWARFTIRDTFDAGNPNLLVTLDRVPAGSTYALSAFYVCSSGGDSTSCSMGTADNEVGRGCTQANVTSTGAVQLATECSGTDESGTLYVRVRAATWGGSCAPHRLTLRVR